MGKLNGKHLEGLDDLDLQRIEPALEILFRTGARQMVTKGVFEHVASSEKKDRRRGPANEKTKKTKPLKEWT
jgi:hypothetical protein